MARPKICVDRVSIEWKPDGSGEYCQATAEVSYPIEADYRRIEWLHSSGLGGIEEPSDAYRATIEREQVEELIDHLAVFGIDTSEVMVLAARSR